MAEIIPFRGVLFDVSRASRSLGEDLLAPPYDIITDEFREELYRRSPYNIVRVDFGKELEGDDERENRYHRARAYLETWLGEGIMKRCDEPFFYSYEISYKIYGEERKLRGFLGLVRIEELGKGNIHPHECTHSKPKKDRLELMRICRANISPIFSLYNSRGRGASSILSAASKTKPYIEAGDGEGAVHRLWKIKDAKEIETIKKELADKQIFIADGHHRYETALEYRDEMRRRNPTGSPMPYDFVLMFLANMADEGLTILPTHRLARKIPANALDLLAPYFTVETVRDNFDIAAAISGRTRAFGFYRGDADVWYLLTYKGTDLSGVPPALADLDVSILHELVLERVMRTGDIAYEMDVAKCLQLVREDRFEAAFFLNPTRVNDVERVALAGLRMPPKSTYFYPKLLTGLVLNIFNNSF